MKKDHPGSGGEAHSSAFGAGLFDWCISVKRTEMHQSNRSGFLNL
jgi:hypothetical protein